jgi:hypothetical protein
MKRWIWLLALAAAPPAFAGETAETVYLAPRQTLPLLAAPQLGATSGRTISTGDALTVLGRQAEFVQVRTPDGAVGWVRAGNLTDEGPPRPDSAIAAENRELAAQVDTLDAQIRAFQAENSALRGRLMQLETEHAAATRPMPLTALGLRDFLLRLLVSPSFWAWMTCAALAVFAAFMLGVRWRNGKIRERLGGLDL